MSELQAKFLIGVMAFLVFYGYAYPMLKQAKQDHDRVVEMVSKPYQEPTPAK